MTENEEVLRRALCRVCRLLYSRGFAAGHDGNVSVRAGEDRILITPAGVCKGRVEPDMLALCSLDGAVLAGSPSSETPMHLLVYRERPDIHGVVHAHPPAATAFAACRRPVKSGCLIETVLGLGEIPVAPYAAPSTQEVPESIRPFVRDRRAVLLANHGALTWGRDLWEAFDNMEILEHTAKTSLYMELLGGGVPLTPEQQARLVRLAAGEEEPDESN